MTRARHFVRDTLLGWELEGLVDDAQLGTSELVANAVRHAGTDLLLTIRADGEVRISIRDGHPGLRRPPLGTQELLAENGRGLHIVAAIADDWGTTLAEGGKVVWFTLAPPDATREDADVLSMAGRRSGRAGEHRAGEQRRGDRRPDEESTG